MGCGCQDGGWDVDCWEVGWEGESRWERGGGGCDRGGSGRVDG